MKGEFWDDFETEKLVKLYKKGLKPCQIAKEITTKSQKSIWNKIDRMIKNGELEPRGEHKTGKEERKPKVTQADGGYYIKSENNEHSRTIFISTEKLKQLKLLYCDDQLTINQVCRKLEIPRRDFHLIKTAFGITKDDIPYISEEVQERDTEDLVDETLERQKEKYFNRLQQKEIEQAFAELAAYRQRDYFYSKVIKEMSVPARPLTFKVKQNVLSDTEAQLNFADWHTGLNVENYWNKYSIEIERQRLQILMDKVIQYIQRHRVKKVHVLNLGDLLHGVIHVSTRVVAEVDVIQQYRITWQFIADILEALAKETEQVLFYSTYGNHSRITEKKQDALDRENLEFLIFDILKEHFREIPNVEMVPNEYDDQIIVAKPCGHIVFGVHGDRDKPDKVAGNLAMMLEMKPYKVFTAHSHHKEQLETHKVDVIMSRSLCGVDDFAKDIRATSRAGQSFYIYTPEGLECTYDITFN